MLVQQPSVNLIRWGILGTSFISETMADAIRQSNHAVLAAIGSRSVVSGNKFSQMYNIDKCYTSYDHLNKFNRI